MQTTAKTPVLTASTTLVKQAYVQALFRLMFRLCSGSVQAYVKALVRLMLRLC
jgi:hypothetical protein